MQKVDRDGLIKLAKVVSQPLFSELFGVSRTTFYRYKIHKNKIKLSRLNLMLKILIIFKESRMTYGAKRIQNVLSEEGETISISTVGKIMRELNIVNNFTKKIKKTKKYKINYDYLDNKIRYIEVEHLNQVWTQDITEIKVDKGKVYLATVMDLYSRKILSYEVSKIKNTDLIIRVLKDAYTKRLPKIGIFIHSDKGQQYRSKKYIEFVEKIGGIRSYTRANYSCADNATQESFHASLKKEDIYLNPVKNFEEAKNRVKNYIEDFYNKKRIHSKLKTSPDRFEELNKNDENYSNDINLSHIKRIDLYDKTTKEEKERMYRNLYEIGYVENHYYEDLNKNIKNYISSIICSGELNCRDEYKCRGEACEPTVEEEPTKVGANLCESTAQSSCVARRGEKNTRRGEACEPTAQNSCVSRMGEPSVPNGGKNNHPTDKIKFTSINNNQSIFNTPNLYLYDKNFLKKITDIPELSIYDFNNLNEYDVNKLKKILNSIKKLY